jgi:hypothetical protein
VRLGVEALLERAAAKDLVGPARSTSKLSRQGLRPAMLLLDPLVRMHRLDENSAADISGLLGLLRHMQRQHEVAIAVVHHMSERSRAQLGQPLRGSTDLHAWSDSAAYFVRRRDQLRLGLEHRSAAAPEPFDIELVTDERGDAPLAVVDRPAENLPAFPSPTTCVGSSPTPTAR